MNIQLFSNNTESTLANPVIIGATTITLTSAITFLTPTNGDWYYLTLDDDTSIEIVKATGLVGNVLTIERGLQGTSDTAFAAGTLVSLRNTSFDIFDSSPQAILTGPSGVLVDGVSGNVMTATQDTLKD